MGDVAWEAVPIDDDRGTGVSHIVTIGEEESWCSYSLRVDGPTDMIIAERESPEIGQMQFPSEAEPIPVRRVHREELGRVPCGPGPRRDTLFGEAIIPHLPGTWVTAAELQPGDTVLRGTAEFPAQVTVDKAGYDGSYIELHVTDPYGGVSRQYWARPTRWVQIEQTDTTRGQ